MRFIHCLSWAPVALALAACAAGPAQPPTASGNPQAVLDRYVAAANAGDMAAIRQLISPQVARSDFVGCTPAMDNPSCLAHYIQATIVGPQAQIQVINTRTEGDTVRATLHVQSALYRQAGVARIVGDDVLRVQAGQIVDFRFVPDFADEPTRRFFATLGIGPGARK